MRPYAPQRHSSGRTTKRDRTPASEPVSLYAPSSQTTLAPLEHDVLSTWCSSSAHLRQTQLPASACHPRTAKADTMRDLDHARSGEPVSRATIAPALPSDSPANQLEPELHRCALARRGGPKAVKRGAARVVHASTQSGPFLFTNQRKYSSPNFTERSGKAASRIALAAVATMPGAKMASRRLPSAVATLGSRSTAPLLPQCRQGTSRRNCPPQSRSPSRRGLKWSRAQSRRNRPDTATSASSRRPRKASDRPCGRASTERTPMSERNLAHALRSRRRMPPPFHYVSLANPASCARPS